MSSQVTQEPNNQAGKILEDSTHKGSPAASGENLLQGHHKGLGTLRQKDGSAESRNNGSGRRILTNDRDFPQPLSPTDSGQFEESHVRPSSRKRRKISNYSQFIDVGASSSSDEGGQPNYSDLC